MDRSVQTAEPSAEHTLTGWKGDAEYFTFRTHDELRAREIIDVLRGRVAGMMFRNVVSPDVCAQLRERFWASPARKTRGGAGPGYYLGAYHYGKTTTEYLDECEAVARDVADVLDVPGEPIGTFRRALGEALAAEGVTCRLAQHEGRAACRALLRSWHAQGAYALIPHDDRSQCTDPKQAGFEIQRVLDYRVAALNICLENGGGRGGGRLTYWNIQPDESSRRRVSAHYTGAYTPEMIEGVEAMRIDVNPGDLYVFNGAHIHAVEPNTDPTGRRTTMAALFGFIDDRTVVSWT